MLTGKIDDVLVDEKGLLVPSDYKSSGDPPREDKYKYYELQLNAYALMIQEKGYMTADHAFLLHYFPKDNLDTSINVELSFKLDKVYVDIDKFKQIMKQIVDFLESPYPGKNYNCRKCAWLEKVCKL